MSATPKTCVGRTGIKKLDTARQFRSDARSAMVRGVLDSGAEADERETGSWVEYDELYLDRCQVDTPERLVAAVWRQVRAARKGVVGKVVDFGAGDGRFARAGEYKSYIGYEIDPSRFADAKLPPNARLIEECAFSDTIVDADVCVGNPPYVRNQDLPLGWRERAASIIRNRIGVDVSGLANAWQYFFLLCLASTKPNGLVALVVPYEWVSRPSARALRSYVKKKGWDVTVRRLSDATFDRVLTTSSITLIDKANRSGRWQYFEEEAPGRFRALPCPSGNSDGVLAYSREIRNSTSELVVRRGLSPGTQEVLTLTEGERLQHGLRVDVDVVACVTSLRPIQYECSALTDAVFRRTYRDAGRKCWLLQTERSPSPRLAAYLNGVPKEKRQTSTCLSRKEWWRFTMPKAPSVLVATGFRGTSPKAVVNSIGAIAVGSVSGVFKLSVRRSRGLVQALRQSDLSTAIVSHSNGLRKLESGQLHTLVSQALRVGIRS